MIEILPFHPDLKTAFYDINAQWISSMFVLEPIDEEVLKNPEDKIINPGGHIFFAKHPELGVVGTCALMKTGEDEFELTKMGVFEKARGLKVGEKLLQYVIQFAKDSKIKNCYLLTNKDCKAAIHLYEKNGFIHDSTIMDRFGSAYERCDVAMRLNLPT